MTDTAAFDHRPAHPATAAGHARPKPPAHPLGGTLRKAHARPGARAAATTRPVGPGTGTGTGTRSLATAAALRHRPAAPPAALTDAGRPVGADVASEDRS
ncbi:hypothetical protein B9W62_18915 [Streptomyces sp. CS113]|uniref:hypothetical protein n=1 Tax=Streptomyces sp. CS113 TaxID=1982761 RepID=UPI000B41EC33|nr:hypothetical protein [Streptomyces sp. CS113]OWA08335.1 hypothetical protein B9W62_18915 [Streptomyces sp. CS113]